MIHIHWTGDLTGLTRSLDLTGARRALAEAVARDSDPFVPYDTGELASSVVVEDGAVRYTADHAAVCYRADRPFRGTKHPKATAHWTDAAKSVCLGRWRAVVAAALTNKGGSGR